MACCLAIISDWGVLDFIPSTAKLTTFRSPFSSLIRYVPKLPNNFIYPWKSFSWTALTGIWSFSGRFFLLDFKTLKLFVAIASAILKDPGLHLTTIHTSGRLLILAFALKCPYLTIMPLTSAEVFVFITSVMTSWLRISSNLLDSSSISSLDLETPSLKEFFVSSSINLSSCWFTKSFIFSRYDRSSYSLFFLISSSPCKISGGDPSEYCCLTSTIISLIISWFNIDENFVLASNKAFVLAFCRE